MTVGGKTSHLTVTTNKGLYIFLSSVSPEAHRYDAKKRRIGNDPPVHTLKGAVKTAPLFFSSQTGIMIRHFIVLHGKITLLQLPDYLIRERFLRTAVALGRLRVISHSKENLATQQ